MSLEHLGLFVCNKAKTSGFIVFLNVKGNRKELSSFLKVSPSISFIFDQFILEIVTFSFYSIAADI